MGKSLPSSLICIKAI